MIGRKDAIKLLGLPESNFDNYFKNSCEVEGFKVKNRWMFDEEALMRWDRLRKERTVTLSLDEYKKCFEFAIKMAYGSKSSHGTGIRGARSEVQVADDFILGILAEEGVAKFLRERFGVEIGLDHEAHPGQITAQDFVSISDGGGTREVKIDVAVKSSKMKSCFNITPPAEYEREGRKSDIYIFARVGLPSDHLFRILRDHSFFRKTSDFLESAEGYRKIEELVDIPVWTCGFSYHNEFEKVGEIPNQNFDGYRYALSVAKMHNSDRDWENLVSRL